MLLDFIWDLYLCFCFPFLDISLVRSVRRWCFLWQTALVWKALWNACRYGASRVISRYLDFKNPSPYAIWMLNMNSWTCSSPHEWPVPIRCTVYLLFIVELMPLKCFLSEHFIKPQVAWQFLSEKVPKRWDAIALWIYRRRNNLTAQNYVSSDGFLIKNIVEHR